VPTYEYACTECGDQIEAVQKFTDDPLSVCGVCGGRLRKVFSPVGIVFKGNGFYRTDSRASSKDLAGAGQKANGDSGPKGDKTGAKPGESSASTTASGNGSAPSGGSGPGGGASGGSAATPGSTAAGKSSAKVA
jgi:putative FmdB family regulatory protein